MIKRLGLALCVIGGIALRVLAAGAEPPSPIVTDLFAFPGSLPHPTSGASAGLASADTRLGNDPSGNPAARPPGGIAISPALLRMSRQDLRADNRRVDEQDLFIDAAGGWLAFPIRGVSIGVYAFQPLLRLEENAFQRGEIGGPSPPAVIQTRCTMREQRAGLAASFGSRAFRLGAAGEWTRRADEYVTIETSGSPQAGERRTDFTGDGFGFQGGMLLALDLDRPGPITFGAAARYVPAITVSGDQRLTLVAGDSLAEVTAEREAGWEAGVSARAEFSTTLAAVAGFGYQTAQEWQGFDARSGAGFLWSVAGEYHDPLDPWSFRFGLGLGSQEDVPESRIGILGIGVGWKIGGSLLDVGIARRSLDRAGHPTSYDHRLVATLHMKP